MSKFLLVGNKLIPEMHQRHPATHDKAEFTYSACAPFTEKQKNKNTKM